MRKSVWNISNACGKNLYSLYHILPEQSTLLNCIFCVNIFTVVSQNMYKWFLNFIIILSTIHSKFSLAVAYLTLCNKVNMAVILPLYFVSKLVRYVFTVVK